MLKKNVLLWMVLLVVSVGAAQNRGMFVGLRQVENCATAVDSMMLQRQNDLYIGQRGAQESMLYNKWLEAPLVYTPMMEAAWSYCQKVVPGEKRLYVDAAQMYRYVIGRCTNKKDSEYYFSKLMQVYDLRLKNLSVVNAHARRVEDLTSRGALELLKIREFRAYNNDRKDAAYNESLYKQYLPVMNGIFETIKQGEAMGSDINATDLQDFFVISFNHYANMVNGGDETDGGKVTRDKAFDESKEREKALRERHKALSEERKKIQGAAKSQEEFDAKVKPVKDSMDVLVAKITEEVNVQKAINEEREQSNLQSNQRTAALRGVLMGHYDGIYSLSDMQKKVLSQDIFEDSTLTEDQQQYEADKINKQYDGLVAYCQSLLSQANINLGESSIADLDMKYGDSIVVNKKNGAWLEMVWSKCNNTTDFDPSDPFCESVYNALQAYIASVAEAQHTEREKQKQLSLRASSVGSQYTGRAYSAWNRGNALLRKGDEGGGLKYLYLALYYFNRAVKEDSSQRTYRDKLAGYVREHDFMVGLKGKTITVDGVTFTAGN